MNDADNSEKEVILNTINNEDVHEHLENVFQQKCIHSALKCTGKNQVALKTLSFETDCSVNDGNNSNEMRKCVVGNDSLQTCLIWNIYGNQNVCNLNAHENVSLQCNSQHLTIT